MCRLLLVLFLVTVPFVVSGCATIASDNKTFVTIDTTPPKAHCSIKGDNYTQDITTPTTINIPAKAAPIDIVCLFDGYHQTSDRVDTKMDGWIFGNILAGGIVGVVIDAATGAGDKYPEKIAITLDKRTFASQNELNSWYDNRESDLRDRFNNDVQIALAGCKGDDKSSCEQKAKKLTARHEETLATVRKNRASSVIIASTP